MNNLEFGRRKGSKNKFKKALKRAGDNYFKATAGFDEGVTGSRRGSGKTRLISSNRGAGRGLDAGIKIGAAAGALNAIRRKKGIGGVASEALLGASLGGGIGQLGGQTIGAIRHKKDKKRKLFSSENLLVEFKRGRGKDRKKRKRSLIKKVALGAAGVGAIGLVGAYGLKKKKDFAKAKELEKSLKGIRSLHKNETSKRKSYVSLGRKRTESMSHHVNDGVLTKEQAKAKLQQELYDLKKSYDESKDQSKAFRDIHKTASKKIRKLRSANPFV